MSVASSIGRAGLNEVLSGGIASTPAACAGPNVQRSAEPTRIIGLVEPRPANCAKAAASSSAGLHADSKENCVLQ